MTPPNITPDDLVALRITIEESIAHLQQDSENRVIFKHGEEAFFQAILDQFALWTTQLETAREDHQRIRGDYERDLTKMTERVQALETERTEGQAAGLLALCEIKHLQGQWRVCQEIGDTFWEALKPLNLQAINVANPGSHVTELIRERDAYKFAAEQASGMHMAENIGETLHTLKQENRRLKAELEELVFISHDHPSAKGRGLQSGDFEWKATFTLDDGRILTVRMGEPGFCAFEEMFLKNRAADYLLDFQERDRLTTQMQALEQEITDLRRVGREERDALRHRIYSLDAIIEEQDRRMRDAGLKEATP